MIKVTRFNGQQYYINADLIEFLEATPDTVITLFTGKKVVVKEAIAEVLELIKQYKREVGTSVIVRTTDSGDEV